MLISSDLQAVIDSEIIETEPSLVENPSAVKDMHASGCIAGAKNPGSRKE
jgi:hypothetical protein